MYRETENSQNATPTCPFPGGSVEIAQLGKVLAGAVVLDLDLRQLRLDPLKLLFGQIDVRSAVGAETMPFAWRPGSSQGRTDPARTLRNEQLPVRTQQNK